MLVGSDKSKKSMNDENNETAKYDTKELLLFCFLNVKLKYNRSGQEVLLAIYIINILLLYNISCIFCYKYKYKYKLQNHEFYESAVIEISHFRENV